MQGDFLGFSFDGVHSSRLGLTRVSDGDRYNDDLLPELEDVIVPIPGNDGNYYFGSQYRTKPFSLSVAFDSITEKQLRRILKLFSTKRPCSLIFDERPYKVYTVKISSPPQFNYICFDERKKTVDETGTDGLRVVREDGGWARERIYPYTYSEEHERIYKGEGTIELVAINPFARQQFKVLELYGEFDPILYNVDDNDPELITFDHAVQPGNVITTYTNINEWAEASGILPYSKYVSEHIDEVVATNNVQNFNAVISLYNPGDVASPFYLYIPYADDDRYIKPPGEGDYVDISLNGAIMRLKKFQSKEDDPQKETGIIINTQNHLIEGVFYDIRTASWQTTGNLYNEYIQSGDFGKIAANDWEMDRIHYSQRLYLNCATALNARIHYNYLYY